MSHGHGGVEIAVLIALSLYLLPSLIAALRGHLDAAAIFVLNLVLGWTGLGWLVALIWSLTGNTRRNFGRNRGP
jgi:Superinfection immunity protein